MTIKQFLMKKSCFIVQTGRFLNAIRQPGVGKENAPIRKALARKLMSLAARPCEHTLKQI